jgi:putative zinc finger/helix-turn-helix YgiT family protein
MKCERCKTAMVGRRTTLDAPYEYSISGLKDVFLYGIRAWRCVQCGAEVPEIPRIAELHQVMASALAQKPGELSGDELRFLRKSAGFPAAKFAMLLGISPEHLSRVENGHHDALGRAADRLARALIMAASGDENLREVLLQLADHLVEGDRKKEWLRPAFRLGRDGWKAAA